MRNKIKNTKQNRYVRGFSLLEISVVIVIIGLLFGLVLKGQALITQAKIKNVAGELNGIASAWYSYKDRYRGSPGDDPRADKRWPAATNVVSGNGNGRVEGSYNSSVEDTETRLVWQHLRLAEFIGGDQASQIQHANTEGGMVGIQEGALGINAVVICSANLSPKIANGIDSQLDDGLADAGSLRAFQQPIGISNPDFSVTTEPAEEYVDDGSSLFTVCLKI